MSLKLCLTVYGHEMKSSMSKNERILSFINFYGYRSVHDFCKKNKLCPTWVGNIINKKVCPKKISDGPPYYLTCNYRKIVWDMADALNVHPDMFFSYNECDGWVDREAEHAFEIIRQYHVVDGNNPEDLLLEYEERYVELNRMIDKCLTHGQRLVIRRRFGINGNSPQSTWQLARDLKLSRSRIQMIEIKALQALRKLVAYETTYGRSIGEEL